MRDLEKDILATLTYFDNFRYPLTQKEIYSFLQERCTRDVVGASLQKMVCNNTVYRMQDYYSLNNDIDYVVRRKKGYEQALKLISKGEKIASFISHFPFVRGIAISGSLSKYFADENADIDFFIITSTNRVWIARSFTHLLKKLSFLFGKQHLLCMNYYIDESKPEIIEKNIFTATEVVTLIPVKGVSAFDNFFEANNWTAEYLPNFFMPLRRNAEMSTNVVKRLVELLLKGKAGNALDTWLMHMTDHRWQRKKMAKKMNGHGNIMSMAVHKHCSKPDPSIFQRQLLETYEKKLSEILKINEQVSLSAVK
ncbi:hypothetical protein QTN47_02715 [Danxiaibacter flavus]|uniref:Nucleotidyltransferase domain-containing protein n=1 Tax=Danxiaibacter flavus TaxID=3049108 RepID=A0ABV3ZBB4_9BACT|nr:hypothetical protein QNM32_02715 [Chitinophagaceae bacterium DXS]